MKLLIAIPSKGRPKELFTRTMRWVSRAGYDVRVFVEPQELEEYREAATDANYLFRLDIKPEQFIDIGENDKGLGFAKSFIANYAKENGYDLVFKMDDDVNRFSGRGKRKADDLMLLEFCEMVGKCRVTFGKYPDVAAIGFPYSFELWEPKQWTAINARLQTCYICRTEYLIGGYGVTEDFAQYIYIRSINKVTLRYGLLGIDTVGVGKGKGGQAFLESRDEAMKGELERLKQYYPALKYKVVKDKDWTIEPDMRGEFFGVKKL